MYNLSRSANFKFLVKCGWKTSVSCTIWLLLRVNSLVLVGNVSVFSTYVWILWTCHFLHFFQALPTNLVRTYLAWYSFGRRRLLRRFLFSFSFFISCACEHQILRIVDSLLSVIQLLHQLCPIKPS